MSTQWFGKHGVFQLATLQKNSVQSTSATTNTMIAAYKQFDDIEVLLQLLDSDVEHFDEGQRAVYDKIRERHEKYRIASSNEVIPTRG